MTTYANPVHLTFEKSDIASGGFHLTATVAGAATACFQVDTGSSGMVMSASMFPEGFDFSVYPCFGPYTIHYYPSTNSNSGIWYYLPVELTGKDGTTVQTNAMVLVCTVTDKPNVAMMGVSAKGEDPRYNALLNAYVPAHDSTPQTPYAPAYVLTKDTVVIGQTHSPGDGFSGATLSVANPPLTPLPSQVVPDPNPNNVPTLAPTMPSWNPPSASLEITAPPETLATTTPTSTTQTLAFEMDTGINQFLVACPQAELPPECLATENAQGQWPFADSTQISVVFPAGSQSPILNYQFTVGQASPAGSPAPLGSSLYMGPASPPQSFSRVNVGICPLRAYSYIYDALNGFLGFKPNSSSPSNAG